VRAPQTVEVAFAGGRLLKDMLRHFKLEKDMSQKAAIRDDLIQRVPHDGHRGRIVFFCFSSVIT
jgi:hypothetical protein